MAKKSKFCPDEEKKTLHNKSIVLISPRPAHTHVNHMHSDHPMTDHFTSIIDACREL